jgi:hypothetical protein
MGARLSEQRTLWQMYGEDAVHGNVLPLVTQHALCPSCDFVPANGNELRLVGSLPFRGCSPACAVCRGPIFRD